MPGFTGNTTASQELRLNKNSLLLAVLSTDQDS
jgi:hypothetical protein